MLPLPTRNVDASPLRLTEETRPYVSISTAKGIMDEIEGQGNPEFRKVVWVKIDEQDPSHWSLGGMTASSEQIAQIYGTIGADGRRVARVKA
jgi:4-oxalocrotonate tautomerase